MYEGTLDLIANLSPIFLKVIVSGFVMYEFIQELYRRKTDNIERVKEIHDMNPKPKKNEIDYLSMCIKEQTHRQTILKLQCMIACNQRHEEGKKEEEINVINLQQILDKDDFRLTAKTAQKMDVYEIIFESHQVEYRTYEKLSKTLDALIKESYYDMKKHDDSIHAKEMEDYEKVLKECDELTSEYDYINNLEKICAIYSTAITLIVTKLKDAVSEYPKILDHLQQSVILTTVKDQHVVINNPYKRQSLLGMLQILKDNYVRVDVVRFQQKLLDLLNSRLGEDKMDNPTAGIQELDRNLEMWNSMEMHKYFTEDIFWTVVLLRKYDINSQLYKSALAHVVEYIHEQTSEDDLLHTIRHHRLQYPGKPILSNLVSWLKVVYTVKSDVFSRDATHMQNMVMQKTIVDKNDD